MESAYGEFMIQSKDAEPIAAKILANEPGDHLEKLTKMCMPYMLYLRAKWFGDISVQQIRDYIGTAAVGDTITRYRAKGEDFLQCLKNRFRDLCYQERRAAQVKRITDLCQVLGNSDSDEMMPYEPSTCQGDDPSYQAVRKEALAIVREAIRKEDPTCLRIIFRHFRGSTFAQIAERLGGKSAKCQARSRHNILHIRQALDWQHPGLRELMAGGVS